MIAHNLPPQPTSFIGREAELTEISDLLTTPDCRLLTLTGPGGIGKTRLALEAARRIIDNNTPPTAFSHGVYFIPLQPLTSSDFIVPTIANALNFSFYDEHDPRIQLLDFLRSKHMLLVMDNFEHVLYGADLLPDILAHAPAVKILATSRERLHLQEEWMLDVRGLPFPEQDNLDSVSDYTAIQFFIQNARRAGYTPQVTDADAITRICQLVEGIPLAIELAAAWVRALPCDAIAREIEHSLDILTTNLRNVPEKHRSMHAVFEHSWMLLSDEEQSVFRKLSVFRGGFRRKASEAVTGANLAILAALVDRSLLRVDADGRYSLQELLRQYAQYQLDRAGETDATSDAHCTYYAEFLEQRVPILEGADQVRALDEIEAELDNIRVSWRRAVAHSKYHEIEQSLDALARFFEIRSRIQEGEVTFGTAVNHLGDVDDTLMGNLLLLQAWFLHPQGKGGEVELMSKASALLPQLDVFPLLPLSLFSRFNHAFGGYEAVLQIHQEHLATATRRSDKWAAAWVLCCMGELALIVGLHTKAEQFFQESLAGFQAQGDRWGYSCVISCFAEIARVASNHQAAQQYLLEQLEISREIGDLGDTAVALVELGMVEHALGETMHSKQYFCEAIKLSLEIRFNYPSARVLFWTATQAMAEAGQIEQAVEILAAIEKYCRECPAIDTDMFLHEFESLKAKLPPNRCAAAIYRGESSEIATVAGAILEYLSMPDNLQDTALGDAGNQSLMEPLTQREMEVLELIAEGLNSREAAERLFISVGTLRWHLKQIYGKLDVHSRHEAIVRAKGLQLLA